MSLFFILLGIALLLILWGIAIYNKLVAKRQMVLEGWSGIDVQLKRRTDLIPNLIASVKGYMEYEKNVLEEVTAMRTRCEQASDGDIKSRSAAEGLLSAALGKFFAVAKNYPDLKASNNFIELQTALSETEDQVQLARRYYNGAVRDLNILVESFPSNVIAHQFHFEKAEFFELENAAERAVPQVSF